MIAPVEPINNSGKIISSIGTVRNDNSLKFIPLYPVKFIIITIEKSITNVDIITEMIADNVFLLKPLANIKEIIEKNANELIQKTGLKPNKITIKQIKYAWGSCSSKKNITLNLELIKYSQQAIRYVILHELCHLKYMNHSRDFWNLVEKYMPNYKQVKKEFK